MAFACLREAASAKAGILTFDILLFLDMRFGLIPNVYGR
jgi:hypothetical protein